MRTHLVATVALGLLLGCGGSSNHQSPADAGEDAALPADAAVADATPRPPVVDLTTTLGVISIELDPADAPVSVANFLSYVDSQFYDGTIFHRVIPSFMIQGGGLTADMTEKPANAPIVDEAANGLKNLRGTIAYARTADPDAATCQFFINLVDNPFLDHQANPDAGAAGAGYAVFGKVTAGLDVVDAIGAVPTTTVSGYQDVPVTAVVITTARRE